MQGECEMVADIEFLRGRSIVVGWEASTIIAYDLWIFFCASMDKENMGD